MGKNYSAIPDLDLIRVFRKNVGLIMAITHITQVDIGCRIGVSRQTINAILNRKNDYQITLKEIVMIRFSIEKLIEEKSKIDERIKELARVYMDEINELL